MTKAVFGLLLAAVFAHIWLASTPLPFGGPNVLLAGLAILGAAFVGFVAPAVRASAEQRGAILAERFRDLRPIATALLVCGLVFVWAVAVSAANGHWDYLLLGKMAFGMGVFYAVFLTVDSVRRATVFALALLAAIAASALFGAFVVLFGEPFTSVWLRLAQVPDEQLRMLLRGATSGLSRHPSTFGMQLAVAIPVALSAVAWSVLRERTRLRVLAIASCYTLFAIVGTMLLVSGSRASLVGAIAGTCVAAWLWLRLRANRRKAALILVLAPIALVALWLIFAGAGLLATSTPADAGHIRGLVADPDAWRRDDTLVGHRFAGHRPGVSYKVGLRKQYRKGQGPWTHAVALADADGGIEIAWRPDETVGFLGYQFRARPAGEREWQPPALSNEYFLPSLPKPAKSSVCTADSSGTNPRLTVGDLKSIDPPATAGSQVEFWNALASRAIPNAANMVRATVLLPSGVEQTVQVRACSADGFGPASQTLASLPVGRELSLTWREAEATPPVEYQYRACELGQSTCGEWRHVWPTPLARGPAFDTIGIGGRTLLQGPPAVGHEFRGLIEGHEYVVEIRTRRVAGFDPALAVVARPDLRGKLVLVWAMPEPAANVVGHQYRLRKPWAAQWPAWRDFQPTLSSDVPVPELFAAETAPADDDSDVRRHTLTGLVPGFVYRVQLRARNNYGYGAESVAVFHAAREDGTLALRWRDAAGASPATGYQFRFWQNGTYQWWQDLANRDDDAGRTKALTVDVLSEGAAEQRAFALTAHDLAGGRIALQRRLSVARLWNESAHTRMWQVLLALRYALDHPLGTAVFAPRRRHMGDETDYSTTAGLPPEEPHNQFLYILVRFGVPGLALHILFYALVAHAAARCARMAARTPTPAFRFLCASAVGACVAYFAASLLLPRGPLLHHWDHFFVIGLLFAVPAISARARRLAGAKQVYDERSDARLGGVGARKHNALAI